MLARGCPDINAELRRLAEQLANATLMSTSSQMEGDLRQILEHARALEEHGQKQAGRELFIGSSFPPLR